MPGADDLAFSVLQAVAWQDERAPLGRDAMRRAVDFYERILPTDAELDGALRQLLSAGHLVAREDGYTLAPALVALLPRTASGAVSGAAAPWRRFRKRLAAVAPPGI